MNNPLINFDQLPRFGEISAEHVLPALQQVLQDCRAEIQSLEQVEQADWDNFANKMEDIDERLDRVWSPTRHLNSVQDSSELREAYQTGIALLTDYHSEVGQNQALFKQYKSIKAGAAFSTLSAAQQKVIENALLDFKLSGAELSVDDQDKLKQINKEVSELSNQFEQNVLDATQAWTKLITDENELKGLPDSALAVAQQAAHQADQQGWLFSLQIPSYLAVMQHAENAKLREQMYRAYVTRASALGEVAEHDNSDTINAILELRSRRAKLLGFENYAEYSLLKKMAQSSQSVLDFIDDLLEHAKPVAEQELAELRDFAQRHYQREQLEPWDISYYSERLREHRYAFNDEQVKPYLPADKVFNGLFEIVSRLFEVDIAVNKDMPRWHEDVRCFDILERDSQLPIGSFYTDIYVRKNKRGGAWMDTCINRRKLGDSVQNPVAFLTCNFSPPVGDKPALLSHDEVETLFHEFGHALHHLLTQVDEMSVAGINGVAWDAVELPSQFLENWCWQEQGIQLFAKHFETSEPLPSELLEKMRAAKNFQSGMQTLRQLEFALFDMQLHSQLVDDDNRLDVQALLNKVRAEVAVIEAPEYNRFQNSFGHIFAGGYAAGYYSYKWSEVLSADAFSKFEENGLFDVATGREFKQSILQRGGVEDANDLFIEFRGRAPSIIPLLQHTGIISESRQSA